MEVRPVERHICIKKTMQHRNNTDWLARDFLVYTKQCLMQRILYSHASAVSSYPSTMSISDRISFK